MREKLAKYLPALGMGIALLGSLPSCIPGIGLWLFAMTWPFLLLGSLLLLVSDASTRFKWISVCALVAGPLMWQLAYLSYHYQNPTNATH